MSEVPQYGREVAGIQRNHPFVEETISGRARLGENISHLCRLKIISVQICSPLCVLTCTDWSVWSECSPFVASSVFWASAFRSASSSCRQEREFFIDNLLVQIHSTIEMICWTSLAPWEFEFPFQGSYIYLPILWTTLYHYHQPLLSKHGTHETVKARFCR